jgi:hypothetical protein
MKRHMFAALAMACAVADAFAADSLAEHFSTPARESGASLYMCWYYGQVTAEGLKREYAAYGQMPIVAVDIDDRASGEMVAGSAVCLSPEWDARQRNRSWPAHLPGLFHGRRSPDYAGTRPAHGAHGRMGG